MNVQTILISRTDSIGDVILTLPLAGYLKQRIPDCRIIFLGREYTRPVVACCTHIDRFLLKEDFLRMNSAADFGDLLPDVILHVFPNRDIARKAKKLKIPLRIGTSHRLYHWFTCNRLPNLGRKNSDWHESLLNIKLSESLGIQTPENEDRLFECYGFNTPDCALPAELTARDGRCRIILHPKSQGSAREYPLEHYARLINMLPEKDYRIFISGTEAEGRVLKPLYQLLKRPVEDITGTMSLTEFIHFISTCDALCAASTGPLHIAAALGIHALGIYVPLRPVYPSRWKPLGLHTKVFVKSGSCVSCSDMSVCECIRSIQPEEIANYLRQIHSSMSPE
jgi:ADP-heptose:LPS heptosyltransferase